MAHSSREQLASRLGFLLLSAGCAIGLGNVWRFPYIAGEYGGAVFVVAYLFFLFAVGLPVIIMEFSIGRAAKTNMGKAFHLLEPKGTYWHKYGIFSLVGSTILMMFYIPVTSWLMAYCLHMGGGALSELNPEQVGGFFGQMLAKPLDMYFWSIIVIVIGFGVCAKGVQKGVERIVKFMMLGLLALLIVLAINSLLLPGAKEGMTFYLAPDLDRAMEAGIWNLLNEAMNQAFFTLSVGIGSMLIFGSYLKKDNTLTGEATYILGLDTFVAIMAGVIIFPVCFTYGVAPGAGPGLIFITLPNVFNEMTGGLFWGTLFFVFMTCAALTTVIAVVENIISYCMDVWGWTRKKSTLVNFILMLFLVLPCILGFSTWSFIEPLGPGTGILDLEDFIVSKILLPGGSLLMLLFCTCRYGWGFDNFVKEADEGKGPKFPVFLRAYLTYVLPIIILVVFVRGFM